jgi:hypothetical protein
MRDKVEARKDVLLLMMRHCLCREMRDKVEARKDVLFESKSAVDGWNEFLEQVGDRRSCGTNLPRSYLGSSNTQHSTN